MKMTFKDFFLQNRDRNFFDMLSLLIEERYKEIFLDKFSPIDQIAKISLYVLWKKFDYVISVVSSQKITKKNIAYDIFCDALLKEFPTGFDRKFVGQIVNIMVDLGILVTYEADDDYHGEKTLFNIKHVFLGISEKEFDTFEEFKNRINDTANFDVFSENSDRYFIDLYYRSIIKLIK